jgi:hypothetical protein
MPELCGYLRSTVDASFVGEASDNVEQKGLDRSSKAVTRSHQHRTNAKDFSFRYAAPGVRKRFEVAYTKLRNAPDAPPARMRSLEITMHQMHRLFFGILLPDNMT